MGEDLIGLLEAMAEEVTMDFGEVAAGFAAVKET